MSWAKNIPSEILFTLGMLLLMGAMSVIWSLPIMAPSGERAAFVGIHYLYPLLGVVVWGVIALIGQRRQLARTFFIALPCYALILWAHFNIKLWVPIINGNTYDQLYWNIDQHFVIVIDALKYIRENMLFFIPADSNAYMLAFIALFYVSFCYHAIITPDKFRCLFLAALFFQALGALSYIPFPALGPFIFEQGLNPVMSGAQASMLSFHQDMLAHDRQWLAINGPANLTAGLAAMPSLHAGGTFLFFLFAQRYGRVLIPLYSVLLGFILLEAVTTRWHYLIDLPIGMLLAWVSLALAERCDRVQPAEMADEKELERAVA